MTKGRNNFYLVSCILIRDANFFQHCVWCIFWKSDVYQFQKYHFHWYSYLTFEVSVSQKCQYRFKSGINLPHFIKNKPIQYFSKNAEKQTKIYKNRNFMPKQAFLLNNKSSQELEYTNVTRKKPFCEPTHDFTEF